MGSILPENFGDFPHFNNFCQVLLTNSTTKIYNRHFLALLVNAMQYIIMALAPGPDSFLDGSALFQFPIRGVWRSRATRLTTAPGSASAPGADSIKHFCACNSQRFFCLFDFHLISYFRLKDKI
jgi:hypothetical protein